MIQRLDLLSGRFNSTNEASAPITLERLETEIIIRFRGEVPERVQALLTRARDPNRVSMRVDDIRELLLTAMDELKYLDEKIERSRRYARMIEESEYNTVTPEMRTLIDAIYETDNTAECDRLTLELRAHVDRQFNQEMESRGADATFLILSPDREIMPGDSFVLDIDLDGPQNLDLNLKNDGFLEGGSTSVD